MSDKKAASKKAGKSSAKDEAKPKRPGIGKMAIEMLKAGELSPEEILAEIKRQVPEAKTTIACVYWYANNQGISLADRRRNEVKDPKDAEKAPAKKKAKAQGEEAVPEVHPVNPAKKDKPARLSPKEIVAQARKNADQKRGVQAGK